MSTFEKALDQWTAVSLPRLQHDLDAHAVEIQEFQASTLESRKTLASKTKEFKRLEEELKVREFKHLLKQYQQEIDSLTERAKTAEQGFFEVYKAIAELPDPKPLLEASLDSVIASQEVQELREKNEELQAEVLKYADYEQVKAKLLRLEQKSAETLANRLKLQEEELSAQFKEKEAQWAQKEEDWKKQIGDLNTVVKDLKTQQKVDKLKLKNQRIALGEDPDADDDESTPVEGSSAASTTHEIESLRKESEAKDKRLTQLESRNTELTRELTRAKSDAQAQEAKLAQELKLSELESENASLVAQLEHTKAQATAGARSKTSQISNLQREVNALTTEVKGMKDKMVQYRDYDEMKKELTTLRAISFGRGDDDDEDEDEQDPVKSSSTQLDEILVHRNKKLTAEIADFRSKHAVMVEKITALENELKNSKQETAKLAQLNAQLEGDVSHLEKTASKYDTMSMISGVTRATTRTVSQGRRLSPASSIAGGVIPEEGAQDSSASVLPIITAQRDRFRARNNELETQLKNQQAQITELRAQIAKLKKDNTELFEKTRYLSSFQGSVRRGNTGADVEAQTAYDQTYEESLHPLAKFRQREQERVASRLSPLERIFLSFAKAILANKTSRMMFLGYCVGLHGVVMLMTIYVMSLHGSLTPDVGVRVVEKATKMGGGGA